MGYNSMVFGFEKIDLKSIAVFQIAKIIWRKKSSNMAIYILSQPMTVVKTVFFLIMILAVVPTTLIRQLQIGGASCTEITLTAG